MLREECEQINKENFKLKQTLMRTEEKLRLIEMRGLLFEMCLHVM
jgi:hypothetical protein